MQPSVIDKTVAAVHQMVKWPLPIVFIATSLLLFGGTSLRETLALDDFVLRWRTAIGASWLLTASYVGIGVALAARSALQSIWRRIFKWSAYEKLVQSLSTEELYVVRQILERGASFHRSDFRDPVMNTLVAREVAFRTINFSVGNEWDGYPMVYGLQPWVRMLAARKPHLFGLKLAA